MLEANKTGVLVFTESVSQLAQRKRVLHNERRNQLMHKTLLERSKVIVEGLSAPVIWWDETFQRGKTFSERLYHAMQAQYDSGYDRLMVIGTDHPNLSKRHIEKALAIVTEGGQVLGPASDGGCYLFSLAQDDFEAFQNAEIHWQNGQEQKEILDFFAERQKECVCLETLEDIDSLEDIKKLLGSKGHLRFLRIMAALLGLNQAGKDGWYNNLIEIPDMSWPDRAPPVGI
jgi:glycosyltransferase A (GT-A) superfamily protein (DUF2064 family)